MPNYSGWAGKKVNILKAFLALAVAMAAFTALAGPSYVVGVIAATMHLAATIWVFLKHGAARVTALCIFSLGSGMFLAMPYMYGLAGVGFEIQPIHQTAEVMAFLCFSIAATVCWMRSPKRFFQPNQWQKRAMLAYASTLTWFLLCLVLISVGVVAGQFGEGIAGRVGAPAVLSAFTLAVVASALHFGAGKKAWMVFAIVAAACFYVYFTSFFLVNGRLRVVAFGTILLLALSLFTNIRILKPAALASIPVLLFLAGSANTDGDYAAADVLQGRNLGSLISPFLSLSKILDEYADMADFGAVKWLYGESYINNLLGYIPRALWPDKPDGLGLEYVKWFMPERIGSGHTVSVSYVGELYVNFGWLGLLVGPYMIGRALVWPDRLVQSSLTGMDPNRMAISIVVATIFSALLADYVWADSNTFTNRAGNAVLLFLMVTAPFRLSFAKRRMAKRMRRMAHAI